MPQEEDVNQPIISKKSSETSATDFDVDVSLNAFRKLEVSWEALPETLNNEKELQEENSENVVAPTKNLEVDTQGNTVELKEIMGVNKQALQKNSSFINNEFNENLNQEMAHEESEIRSSFYNPRISSIQDKGVSFESRIQSIEGINETYSPHESIKDSDEAVRSVELSSDQKLSEKSVSIHLEEGENEQDSKLSTSDIIYDRFRFIYEYKGSYDTNHLRSNFGCLKWISTERRQYCGYLKCNSMHGQGCYFKNGADSLMFYDGNFYNNELHGYGQLIYSNGDKFEGLFRENIRYGPGVLSYVDGSQDVGMWLGNSLIRLNTSISGCIPLLGKTTSGKLKLLEYKRLVPINCTDHDEAYKILENLNADEETKKRSRELYNPHVRNKNSIFFDKSGYDLPFFGPGDCYIDVVENNTLPDFIMMKKEFSHEKLNEEISKRNENIKEIQEEITMLKNTINHLKTKCRNEINELEKCDEENLDVKEEIESLLRQELFFSKVLELLCLKLKNNKERSGKIDIEAKKVYVDSILAWNNGDALVDILLHSFLCRKSEVNVGLNVREIIIGKRHQFGPPGTHEKATLDFLKRCASSDCSGALNLIMNEKVNPNVCDSKGNTALHLATWNRDTKTIRMLANNGANLDCVNDEGITPLNLCLLQYLETVYEVFNWESSFLNLNEISSNRDYLIQWRPHESFLNLHQFPHSEMNVLSRKTNRSSIRKRISMKRSGNINTMGFSSEAFRKSSLYQDPYIFSLKYPRVRDKPRKSLFKQNSDDIGETTRDKPRKSLNQRSAEPLNMTPDDMARSVCTLKTLLRYGADPNKDSVPHPPLFLALFSKCPKIVKRLLEKGSDVNMNLQGMTPLQVVAAMELCEENCNIMRLLIDFYADLDILSDPSIWQECDKYLLGDYEPDCEIQVRGKDALHLVCLREDFTTTNIEFLCKMAEMLIRSGINTRRLYLGHSHLSMAIIKGNLALIECLLGLLDPRRPLGFGLGNALTILALSRYPNHLQFSICRDIIDLLLFDRISPFDSLYCYSNIFEFLEVDSPWNYLDNLQGWNKYLAYVKPLQVCLKKEVPQDTDKSSSELTKFYLQQKSRDTLDIANKYKAMFYLYYFVKEGSLNEYTNYLAKYVGNSEESLTFIRYIFNKGMMPRCFFSLLVVARLMKYVDNVNNIKKTVEIKPDEISVFSFQSHVRTTSLSSRKTNISILSARSQRIGRQNTREYNVSDYLNELDESQFEETEDVGPEYIDRWVSEEDLVKRNVCYFCMQRSGKTLLRCPACGVVKFCSERCNYLSVKLKHQHPCPNLFYRDIYKQFSEFIDNNLQVPAYGIDLAFEKLNGKPCSKLCTVIPKIATFTSTTTDTTTSGYTGKSVVLRLRAGADSRKTSLESSRNSNKERFHRKCNELNSVEKKKSKQNFLDGNYHSYNRNNEFKEKIEKDTKKRNIKTSRKITFPPIVEHKPVRYKSGRNSSVKERNFENDMKLVDKKKSMEMLEEKKKMALRKYQYFFREIRNFDLESIFMPFTCCDGDEMFHSIAGTSNSFYQSFYLKDVNDR